MGKMPPPQPTFERVKRALFLVGLATALEFVDPLPFVKSLGYVIIYGMLVFEVAKQFLRFRLENSSSAVARAEAYKNQWEVRKNRLDENARYRIRRFLITLAGLWVYGQVISLFTDRCEGGFQCALLSVNLLVENIPTILQIMLGVAFGLMQMFFMFYAMTKVGFLKVIPPGTVDVTFDDIYGQDKARDRVREQVQLLENDAAVTAAGGYMPKGMLLTGPPGTGKTMLAKAAANASTKPLILIPPGGFASTFIGINFLKVHSLGRTIRKQSKRHGGVIVFFDEIDSLGNRGGEVEGSSEDWFTKREEGCMASEPEYHPVIVTGGGSGGMNMGTLEAFLSMMDGMEEPRGFVNKLLAVAGFKPLPPPKVRPFYLGATNRPSVVDPALKRAGRFGREIRVDFPKYDGRLQTYVGYLGKVTHNLSDTEVEWLARNHYRGTGAEIQDIINEALLISFRNLESDHETGIVTFGSATDAMLWKRFGESDGTFENPENVRSVAVHEAGHAVVMHALRKHKERIWFASIEQRGKTGGMVARSPLDDDWKEQSSDMLASVAISLASRVAEVLVNGQMSNGHGGDGPAATNMAERMVLLGHGNQIGFSRDREPEEFHKEREKFLREGYALAEGVLTEHRDALEALADALVAKPTLIGDEVHALLEGYGI
jgi:ATP-dependent Zn protease